MCGAYIGLAFDDGRVELWAWFGSLVFGGLLEATYVVRRCLRFEGLESIDVEDSKRTRRWTTRTPLNQSWTGSSRASRTAMHRLHTSSALEYMTTPTHRMTIRTSRYNYYRGTSRPLISRCGLEECVAEDASVRGRRVTRRRRRGAGLCGRGLPLRRSMASCLAAGA